MLCLWLALFALPQNPVWKWAGLLLKHVVESAGSDVTGVTITVGSLDIGVWHANADLTEIVTFNPDGFTASPYFMKCDSIHADVSWMRLFLSWFNVLEIEAITIKGMSLFIEQDYALTNVLTIIGHVEEHPVAKWAISKLANMKKLNTKMLIDKIHMEDMDVHIVMKNLPSAHVRLPSLTIAGIGVKEGGLPIDALIGQTMKAINKAVLKHGNVEANVVRSIWKGKDG